MVVIIPVKQFCCMSIYHCSKIFNELICLHSFWLLLLFFRSQLKESIGSANLFQKTKQKQSPSTASGRLSATANTCARKNSSPKLNKIMTPEQHHKIKLAPVTSTVQKSSARSAGMPSGKLGSPIPCGDSFFEDDAVLSQTHVDFMSKFSRHSMNGSLTNYNDISSANSTPVSFPATKSTPAVLRHNKNNNSTAETKFDYFNSKKTDRNCGPASSFVSHSMDNDRDMFDSIDDDMNLQMAEDFDFDYQLCEQSAQSNRQTKPQRGNSESKTDYSNYSELNKASSDDLIEDFDDDENFNEIISSQESLPQISKPKSSRPSVGMFRLKSFTLNLMNRKWKHVWIFWL